MLLQTAQGAERLMRDGDLVVVYERFDSMKAVTLSAKGTFSNKFGNFPMKVGRHAWAAGPGRC